MISSIGLLEQGRHVLRMTSPTARENVKLVVAVIQADDQEALDRTSHILNAFDLKQRDSFGVR